MSHEEERSETRTWTVNVCDACGHAEEHHAKEPRRVDLRPGEFYIASGCMVVRPGGRELPGEPRPNRFRRCPCEVFT